MKTLANNSSQKENLKNQYSFKSQLLKILILVISGITGTLAFPEFNISFLAFVTIIPVFLITRKQGYWRSIFYGYIWSYSYCVALFFWLREIHIASPFILCLLLACFYMPLFLLNPLLRRRILYPTKTLLAGYEEFSKDQVKWIRRLFYCSTLAAIWTISEWLRSWVLTGLPWNYLATTQWQNIAFIQICEYTGIWGVSFLIAFVNFALVEDYSSIKKMIQNKTFKTKTLPYTIITALILITTNYIFGYISEKNVRSKYETTTDKEIVKFGVVQGDLSQRRNANATMALEAIYRYITLTKTLRLKHPEIDVVVWPESATPMPYNIGGQLGHTFQIELFNLICQVKKPFLIGAMYLDDYVSPRQYKMLNSVLLFDVGSKIKSRYDKIHIVPFGEYVPAREYLPKFLLKIIDMGRDLKAGTNYSPLELKDNVFIGVNICFEDVFPKISRKEAQLGANVLLTVSNDAWYPKSSEPTQHLANSIFRSIETRLPMVRNGNNSSSVLVSPTGEVIDSVFNDGKGNMYVKKRGQGVRQFTVNITKKPQHSFYTRYGDIFIWFCWAILITAIAVTISKMYQFAKHCDDIMKKIN